MEGTHEAIIDRATFEAVQRGLKLRTRTDGTGETHLLSGLVKCADCGSTVPQPKVVFDGMVAGPAPLRLVAGGVGNAPLVQQIGDVLPPVTLQRPLVDLILCKSQSRFTRDMELVEKYIHGLFPIWGIRFIAVADNADTEVKVKA